jgi:hypothetical protein
MKCTPYIIAISLITVSCKRHYNCVCSTPLKETSNSIRETKKKADKKCVDIENELKAIDNHFKCVLQ